MPDLVQMEVTDGVAVIRLDRPPANAISLGLSTQLVERLTRAAADDAVGALVLWGGPKLFAAGADIKEMVDMGPDEIRVSVGKLGEACDLVESMPKISIAAITGYALGGGFELSLACDLRYAAEDAKLGQPEVAIGVIPGAGGTQRMSWLAGVGVARDLSYTGRQVGAREAKELRLVERVLPADEVLDTAIADARTLAAGPRRALAAAKEAILGAVRTPGPEGMARERELFVALFGGHDQREGMRAFIEKRRPTFEGN